MQLTTVLGLYHSAIMALNMSLAYSLGVTVILVDHLLLNILFSLVNYTIIVTQAREKCDNLILAPVMMLALACSFHGILSALIRTHNNLHHVQILIIIDLCRMLKKTKDSIEESHDDLIKTKNSIKQYK